MSSSRRSHTPPASYSTPPSPTSSSSSHDEPLASEQRRPLINRNNSSYIRMVGRSRLDDEENGMEGSSHGSDEGGKPQVIVRDHALKHTLSDGEDDDDAHIHEQPVRSGAEHRISGEDGDLTVNDLFDPQRTAKENKSILMGYELDRMQMGRYQWFVFVLCGFGYFVDLMWAQALGLIAKPLRSQPGFNADRGNIATLSTAFNVGLTVGAFTWGLLVDVIGRRYSFYLTCLTSGVFGIASGASPSFTALRVLTALTGLGVGGNIPIDATITMEILPTNRRFLLALLSLFQPVGVLVASGIAYGYIPKYSCGAGNVVVTAENCPAGANNGWRYYLYTLGAITLFIFFLRFFVFNFRESPAYLINRGRDRRALRAVANIAKTNGKTPLFTIDDFKEVERRCRLVRASNSSAQADMSAITIIDADDPAIQAEQKQETYWQSLRRTSFELAKQLRSLKILFRDSTMTRVTLLLWITFIADFFSFNIAGFFLPQILVDRGAQNDVPLSETYRDYVAIYAPGIAACLLAGALVEIPRLGRQWTMVISSALMAISMFLYTIVDSQAASVGLNALEYFMQSLFNSILYAYTPEVYPSAVRGTAAGLTSTLGRIAGIVAPLAGGALYGPGGVQAAKNTLFLGGGVALVAPVAIALLPYDTRGRRSY